MKITIETYFDNKTNQRKVWIGHEDGSGAEYSYKTVDDLLELISAYVKCYEEV